MLLLCSCCLDILIILRRHVPARLKQLIIWAEGIDLAVGGNIIIIMAARKYLVGWNQRLLGQIVLVSKSLFHRTDWMKRRVCGSSLECNRKCTASCKWRHKVLAFTLNQNVMGLLLLIGIRAFDFGRRLDGCLDLWSLLEIKAFNFLILILLFRLWTVLDDFNRDVLCSNGSWHYSCYLLLRLILGPQALHPEGFISSPQCIGGELWITWQTFIFVWRLMCLLPLTLLEWLRVILLMLWVVAGGRVTLVVWWIVFILGYLLGVVLRLLNNSLMLMVLMTYWLFHTNGGPANMLSLLLLWKSSWLNYWSNSCLLNLNISIWNLRVWFILFFLFRLFIRWAQFRVAWLLFYFLLINHLIWLSFLLILFGLTWRVAAAFVFIWRLFSDCNILTSLHHHKFIFI